MLDKKFSVSVINKDQTRSSLKSKQRSCDTCQTVRNRILIGRTVCKSPCYKLIRLYAGVTEEQRRNHARTNSTLFIQSNRAGKITFFLSAMTRFLVKLSPPKFLTRPTSALPRASFLAIYPSAISEPWLYHSLCLTKCYGPTR